VAVRSRRAVVLTCAAATEPWTGKQGGKATLMPTGTVKWFSDEKGYGFISPDEGEGDLFVHYSGIEADGRRTLEEGSQVSYESEAGDKGPRAVNVKPV